MNIVASLHMPTNLKIFITLRILYKGIEISKEDGEFLDGTV